MPIRYGRMMASPFAFLRGSVIVMSQDLASTPKSGIQTQLCGDAHLLNFGAYASPERALLFDLNDFDETLPGPWEWDIKRLAASFVVAGRDNGFDASDCHAAAQAVTASYRQRMAEFSEMGELEVWYTYWRGASPWSAHRSWGGQKTTKKLSKNVRKTRGRDSLQALSKLTKQVDGRRIINDDPPLLVRIPEGHELRAHQRHPGELQAHPARRSSPPAREVPLRGCSEEGSGGRQRGHQGLRGIARRTRPG